MAYLKTCPTCKKQFSSRADHCPHCGDISPEQKSKSNSQANSSQKRINIVINAGEEIVDDVENQKPRFSKIENPKLKKDYYCSACKYYYEASRFDFIKRLFIRVGILTVLSAVVFYIPNIFGWWTFFSVLFKIICLIVWVILFLKCWEVVGDSMGSWSYCKNEHVNVAVGNDNPAGRLNTNFKCKFWRNKNNTEEV